MEIKTGLTPVELPVIDQNTMASIVDQLMTHVVNVQKAKGGEYSGAKNALGYFEALGAETEVLPEKVVWIFLNKHLGSIRSYLNGLNYLVDGHDKLFDELPVLSEPIEGRIVDAITYLCLFAGLVHRRRLQHLNSYPPQAKQAEANPPTGRDLLKQADDLTGGNTIALLDACMSVSNKAADRLEKEGSLNASDLRFFEPVPKVEGQSDELPPVLMNPVEPDDEVEPMADREAFTPAPTPVVCKDVSYQQIVQQQARLTLATAGYGMYIRLLFDKDGNVVDPSKAGADIASSKRYRVVAQFDGNLVVIGEQGKVQTLNTATTACYFYTNESMWPVLPTLGQAMSRGCQFVGLAPHGSDWSGIAQMSASNSEIVYTDMNVVAAEVNGA